MSKPRFAVVRGPDPSAVAHVAASPSSVDRAQSAPSPFVPKPTLVFPIPGFTAEAPAWPFANEPGQEVAEVCRHFFPKHHWRWIFDYGLWCTDCGIDGVVENLHKDCNSPNSKLCASCEQRPASILDNGHLVCGSCANVGEGSNYVDGAPPQRDIRLSPGAATALEQPASSPSPTLNEEIHAEELNDSYLWYEVENS